MSQKISLVKGIECNIIKKKHKNIIEGKLPKKRKLNESSFDGPKSKIRSKPSLSSLVTDNLGLESDILDKGALSNFKITKKSFGVDNQSPHIDEIDICSKEFRRDLEPTLLKHFRETRFLANFKILRGLLVHNPQMLASYSSKRQELRELCGTSREALGECYAYLLVANETVGRMLCMEGLSKGNSKICKLGQATEGVVVSRYPDFICPASGLPQTGWMLVVKCLKGRVYIAPEDSQDLDPQPNYDSHIGVLSAGSFDLSNASLSAVHYASSIYLYEYSEDFDSIVDKPRHVIPYALIQFSFNGSISSRISANVTSTAASPRICLAAQDNSLNVAQSFVVSQVSADRLGQLQKRAEVSDNANLAHSTSTPVVHNKLSIMHDSAGGAAKEESDLVKFRRICRPGPTLDCLHPEGGRVVATAMLQLAPSCDLNVEFVTFEKDYFYHLSFRGQQLMIHDLLSVNCLSMVFSSANMRVSTLSEVNVPGLGNVSYLRVVGSRNNSRGVLFSRAISLLRARSAVARIFLPVVSTQAGTAPNHFQRYLLFIPDGHLSKAIGIPCVDLLNQNFLHCLLVCCGGVGKCLGELAAATITTSQSLPAQNLAGKMEQLLMQQDLLQSSLRTDKVPSADLLRQIYHQQADLQKQRLVQIVTNPSYSSRNYQALPTLNYTPLNFASAAEQAAKAALKIKEVQEESERTKSNIDEENSSFNLEDFEILQVIENVDLSEHAMENVLAVNSERLTPEREDLHVRNCNTATASPSTFSEPPASPCSSNSESYSSSANLVIHIDSPSLPILEPHSPYLDNTSSKMPPNGMSNNLNCTLKLRPIPPKSVANKTVPTSCTVRAISELPGPPSDPRIGRGLSAASTRRKFKLLPPSSKTVNPVASSDSATSSPLLLSSDSCPSDLDTSDAESFNQCQRQKENRNHLKSGECNSDTKQHHQFTDGGLKTKNNREKVSTLQSADTLVARETSLVDESVVQMNGQLLAKSAVCVASELEQQLQAKLQDKLQRIIEFQRYPFSSIVEPTATSSPYKAPNNSGASVEILVNGKYAQVPKSVEVAKDAMIPLSKCVATSGIDKINNDSHVVSNNWSLTATAASSVERDSLQVNSTDDLSSSPASLVTFVSNKNSELTTHEDVNKKDATTLLPKPVPMCEAGLSARDMYNYYFDIKKVASTESLSKFCRVDENTSNVRSSHCSDMNQITTQIIEFDSPASPDMEAVHECEMVVVDEIMSPSPEDSEYNKKVSFEEEEFVILDESIPTPKAIDSKYCSESVNDGVHFYEKLDPLQPHPFCQAYDQHVNLSRCWFQSCSEKIKNLSPVSAKDADEDRNTDKDLVDFGDVDQRLNSYNKTRPLLSGAMCSAKSYEPLINSSAVKDQSCHQDVDLRQTRPHPYARRAISKDNVNIMEDGNTVNNTKSSRELLPPPETLPPCNKVNLSALIFNGTLSNQEHKEKSPLSPLSLRSPMKSSHIDQSHVQLTNWNNNVHESKRHMYSRNNPKNAVSFPYNAYDLDQRHQRIYNLDFNGAGQQSPSMIQDERVYHQEAFRRSVLTQSDQLPNRQDRLLPYTSRQFHNHYSNYNSRVNGSPDFMMRNSLLNDQLRSFDQFKSSTSLDYNLRRQ